MTGNPLVPVVAGAGDSLKRRFQYFSSSGTFYPTQAMLDAGGVLELDIRSGGGGGGYDGLSNFYGHPGGSGRHVCNYQLTSTASITVTIGTGGAGAGNGTGTQGGTSTFGTVSVPGGLGGGPGTDNSGPGKGSGNLGQSGKVTVAGVNNTFTAKVVNIAAPETAWAGSGAGGGAGAAGQDGSITVSWWEKA